MNHKPCLISESNKYGKDEGGDYTIPAQLKSHEGKKNRVQIFSFK